MNGCTLTALSALPFPVSQRISREWSDLPIEDFCWVEIHLPTRVCSHCGAPFCDYASLYTQIVTLQKTK